MKRNEGAKLAQSFGEMTETMQENKKRSLASTRGQATYKTETGIYRDNELRALVSASTAALVNAATTEKVSLENTEDVKKRTVIYLRACEETGTFPSKQGLARALGYSTRALEMWMSKKPNSETGKWLAMYNDLCSDILGQSALKNNANTIMSIFLSKAMYGLRETNELVITPNRGAIDEEEHEYSPDEIRARYLGVEAQKDGE